MTDKQVKYIWYGFTRNSQDPLDPRFKISSLTNLNTELKLPYRYNGLIFHVKDINKMYVFLNDLNNPVDLSSYISGNIFFGFENTDQDYSNLLVNLNDTNPSLGSLVTVYPLGVTFIYDGNAWKYFSGIYNVVDDTILNSIPTTLKKVNAQIDMGANSFLFDATLTKNLPIIVVTVKPNTPVNDRYYSINGIIYHSYFGNWIRISDKVFISSILLQVGNSPITHNLNSDVITVDFSFTDLETESKTTVPLAFHVYDNNSIIVHSKISLSGELTITSKQ